MGGAFGASAKDEGLELVPHLQNKGQYLPAAFGSSIGQASQGHRGTGNIGYTLKGFYIEHSVVSETRSHDVALAGLELIGIHLPLPPEGLPLKACSTMPGFFM